MTIGEEERTDGRTRAPFVVAGGGRPAATPVAPRLGAMVGRAVLRWLPRAVLVVVLAYLVLPPIVLMIWKSFIGGISMDGAVGVAAYRRIFAGSLLPAIADTLIFSVSSALIALIVGSVLAWFAARTDAPGRRLTYVAIFAGLGVPGIVNIIGWILLFGAGRGPGSQFIAHITGGRVHFDVESMGGMILVEGILAVPIVFLLMVGPLELFDSSFEEAAWMHGARRSTIMRRIAAPMLRPLLLSVALLTLVRTLEAFEVPALLGIPAGTHVFTAQVYSSLHSAFLPDYSGAAAYGSILIVILAVFLVVENRLARDTRRFAVVGSRATAQHRHRLRRGRYLPATLATLLLCCYLLPTLYLIYSAFSVRLGSSILDNGGFTLDNFAALFRQRAFRPALTNTLEVVVVTAAAVVVLSLITGWLAARGGRFGSMVNLMANFPLVVPSIVLGFAMMLFYLYAPNPIYGTLWPIVLAFVAKFLPYGQRAMRPAIMGISAELEEAAAISGATRPQTLRRVIAPLVGTASLGSGLFVFYNAFRELGVAIALVSAATPLLSTLLFNTLINGDLNLVSALGVFIMAASTVVGALAFVLLGARRVPIG